MSVPVSVVMTVYNGRNYLLSQVESILCQLETGDELIVVNDSSTDDSIALLKKLNSPLMKIYSNAQNQGVIRSFERGLGLAREDIIFLCDQDDIWLPGKRAAFIAAFQRDRAALVVISDAQVIDAEGNIVAESFMAVRRGFKSGLMATLWRSRYLGCAMAVRRSLLALALPIPRLVPMQDMWLGVIGRIKGGVVYIDTPYIQYRRHGKNVTPLRSQLRWRNMVIWRMALLLAVIRRMAALTWRPNLHT